MLTRVPLLLLLIVAVPAAQEPPRQIFRASTRLVTIDALVHAKDGEPVRNLKADDFRLFEDGKEQRIELFTVVAAAAPASAAGRGAATLPDVPGAFSNLPGGRMPSTATVILFDRLNSRFEDQVPARAEIVKFLGQLRPDDRVALYVLESDTVSVLHDFTRESRSLIAAMKRYRAQTSIEQAITDAPSPQLAPSGVASVDAEMQAWLDRTTQEVALEFTRRRVQYTYAAIETIAAHLSGVPGRKNLVWVSSAFPSILRDPLSGPQTMSREQARVIQAINGSNLSIYPIDIRGLVAPYAGPAATETYQKVGRGGAPAPASVSAAMQPNIDTMTELAQRTGGRAFTNTNAIGKAIENAIDDARVTYLLGYYPSNNAWDGKFRKLRVTVRAPDVEVRHRSGYLAVPQSATKADERMADLVRAPLESTAIGLAVALEGSALTIRVDPSAITLKPSGDLFDVALDILIVETQKSGSLVKHLEKTLNLRLSAAQRDELMREGFSMTRTLERRAPDSRLQVIVRDVPTGAVGSVRF